MPNNLSHTIRTINRFELKYLLPLRQAEAFKQALSAYLSPDKNGNGEGRYNITSLYYDSPDLRFYWEKMNGIKFRRKLRIRQYETGAALSAESPVFVEIKQHLDRVTQKRRVLLPYKDALYLCDQREIPQHEPADKAFIDEVYTMLWQYNLQPVSLIRYDRSAWIGSDYDIGLRITFDTNLTYSTGQQNLHQVQPSLPMFPPDWVIMEIKVNERIPYWLTELVAAHNLQLTRVSKYCRSIELSQDFRPVRFFLETDQVKLLT